MNQRIALSLALLLCLPVALAAGEKKVLFNGKSLEGWSGNPEIWSVQDGQIVGSTVGKKIKANTFLVWEGGEVDDFELTFKARVEGNNNSGVQYRSKLADPKTWRVIGYQADLHPAPNYIGMLYGEGTGRGIIAERGQKVTISAETGKPEVVGSTGPVTPIDITKWHEYTVIAKGNHLIHKIDGQVATEITDNHKEAFQKGIVALQVHAGPEMTAYFKDIELKPLGDAVSKADGEPSAESNVASWIWLAEPNDTAYLRRTFTLTGPMKHARLAATCDNRFTLFVNGKRALQGDNWSKLETAEISKHLQEGDNVLSVEAVNSGGPAGFVAHLQITPPEGEPYNIVTDAQWKVDSKPAGKWRQADFDATGWQAASIVSPLDGKNSWASAITSEKVASVLQAATEATFKVAIPNNIKPKDGFQVEHVFHVPEPMGSWVALANYPGGRLVASDQGAAGLFLITPGDQVTPTKVERLPVDISSAQGLLWAFDSLYVMVNGPDPGLYRCKDTDGDGLVDAKEYLMNVPGGGEHGPHAIIPSPDGKSLFVCAGNHTDLPEKIAASRAPSNWGEDHLLPRRWDANGHAAGRLAPAGWICKVDPDGRTWEVFSIGYRNNYDIAFNADGELFGYDADMEWDLGSPWYRPTRVCHATSGSEFGWRSGTGKWPAYYEDSVPGVLDIGPGSPTGILFGYGAKFPGKYQRALYLLDWTYSTIYAVHLTPDGSSYSGTKEDFVTGDPMPVTDGVVGADGALYYAVGGRGTQSDLYRVTYIGAESTAPVDAKDSNGTQLRALRHQLEAMHGPTSGDLDFILANLGHEDRFIRYAARVALEHQPVDSWRERVLAETRPLAAINGLIALARQGVAEDRDAVLQSLGRIDWAALEAHPQLGLLRAYALAFIRLGEPSEEQRQQLVSKFDALYPAKSDALNAELVQLLVYLRAPSVVEKTLKLMDELGKEEVPDWGYLVSRNERYGGTVGAVLNNMPPLRGIHFAFTLRNAKEGWTLEQRKKYFSFFLEAAKHPGGASYPGFLTQMREDALLTCSPAEKVALEPITSKSLVGTIEVSPPKGPGRKWTKEEALKVLGSRLRGRNYDRGRNLYHAALCAKCHRYNAEGGAIGPDLSTAAQKFSMPDLLDSIIEPSKVISDQYGSHRVLTAEGEVIEGRVVEIGDELHIYTVEANAPPKVVKKSDVEMMEVSKVSQMPKELIDPLNEEELLDLIAYLKSGGNRRAPEFRP